MSYTPPFVGSIRATACLKRYAKECEKAASLFFERKTFLSSITVIQPKVEEGEEVEEAPKPIELDAVLFGRAKARIRVGNAFGSVAKVNAKLEYIDGLIAESAETRQDCYSNLQSMIGNVPANKAIRAVERKYAV